MRLETLLVNPENYMLPCLNKQLFGIECMGCGLQRSVSLILHGNFIDAFYMYPAIYTLIIMLGAIFLNMHKNSKILYRIIIIFALFNTFLIIGNFIYKTFLIN